MSRGLLDEMRAAVRRWDLLRSGDVVLVALSGGADSVALLAALRELAGAFAIEVVAGHLDHQLRGAESAGDRAFVEELAASLDVRLHVEAARVPAGNMEAEARRVRYAFLDRAASELGATKIATAHTLDDQAETVLLRLLRGAGRRGLGGIRPRRGRIIRPLIGCDRVQVRAFLVERGLAWRRDRSNFDFARTRTRVRLGYLPALAREFNPRLTRALARLADVQRDEDALLDRLAATVPGIGERLDLRVLRELEAALARRVLRRWWRRAGGERRLGLAHVEAALALARRASGGGSVRVPGGEVVRDADSLTLRRAPAGPADAGYERPLPTGAAVTLPGGWCLRSEEMARADAPRPDDHVAVFDAARVVQPLLIRTRRAGDRIRPLGVSGHTSIKRLLITRRVPRSARATHPLVIAAGEIVWVPGCARSDHALVGAATERVLVIYAEHDPRVSG